MSGHKLKISVLSFLFLLLSACASSTPKRYITSVEEPSNYKAHPASYLVDRFPVDREIETREQSPIPFYFQKCSRSVGNYIGTNTAYDCD